MTYPIYLVIADKNFVPEFVPAKMTGCLLSVGTVIAKQLFESLFNKKNGTFYNKILQIS